MLFCLSLKIIFILIYLKELIQTDIKPTDTNIFFLQAKKRRIKQNISFDIICQNKLQKVLNIG